MDDQDHIRPGVQKSERGHETREITPTRSWIFSLGHLVQNQQVEVCESV